MQTSIKIVVMAAELLSWFNCLKNTFLIPCLWLNPSDFVTCNPFFFPPPVLNKANKMSFWSPAQPQIRNCCKHRMDCLHKSPLPLLPFARNWMQLRKWYWINVDFSVGGLPGFVLEDRLKNKNKSSSLKTSGKKSFWSDSLWVEQTEECKRVR